MCGALAYAQSSDTGPANLVSVLWGASIVAGSALLAFVVVVIARRRRHRQLELITVAAIVWGLITAATSLYAQQSQMNWSNEYTIRLQSGYFDPQDSNDAPKLPWGLWTGLGIAYAAMLGWAMSQNHPATPMKPGRHEETEAGLAVQPDSPTAKEKPPGS